MSGQSPVIYVMGTSSGKSLLFMLPAFSSSGTTIVIVLIIALREDMKRRCVETGISCHEWESEEPIPTTTVQIVLVTPESSLSKGFQGYMNRIRSRGQLDRVVFDEAHVVLDSTDDFRPQMQELGALLRHEVQMVYLTATLPPQDESTLFERMMINPY
jgi:superfamily II DNA helicase RecQ